MTPIDCSTKRLNEDPHVPYYLYNVLFAGAARLLSLHTTRTLTHTQMGLPVELCRALAAQNINTPTPIQKASLPVSLAGESVLLCAETGSGKSLAFLLPLVARLKNDELALGIKARPK